MSSIQCDGCTANLSNAECDARLSPDYKEQTRGLCFKCVRRELAELKSQRQRADSSDSQLCYLSNWCNERFGIDSNKVIGREDWPSTLTEVVAKAVDDHLEALRKERQQITAALCMEGFLGESVAPIGFIIPRLGELMGKAAAADEPGFQTQSEKLREELQINAKFVYNAAIVATPTGPMRNKLTELNISRMRTLDRASGTCHSVALLEGYKIALETFAYWKGGVQYVGSCGTTLKEALAEADRRFLETGEL